ncbi:unnamed protein product [Kuraishia capsulata CBS 1993]|uniref:Uncharacterized protein n=1 Tax=Kuraishia capsulata CBS 1993 TaxID=1382522 RepID=W6MFX4_9ASCO|nr:uncharacterized protein KUCA_T00000517001 [Kuraishia capsulata CBS 1993]CDK24551.1 unnamed protein product [Kuraishia capsulata CBS 1993]
MTSCETLETVSLSFNRCLSESRAAEALVFEAPKSPLIATRLLLGMHCNRISKLIKGEVYQKLMNFKFFRRGKSTFCRLRARSSSTKCSGNFLETSKYKISSANRGFLSIVRKNVLNP